MNSRPCDWSRKRLQFVCIRHRRITYWFRIGRKHPTSECHIFCCFRHVRGSTMKSRLQLSGGFENRIQTRYCSTVRRRVYLNCLRDAPFKNNRTIVPVVRDKRHSGARFQTVPRPTETICLLRSVSVTRVCATKSIARTGSNQRERRAFVDRDVSSSQTSSLSISRIRRHRK